MQRGAGTWRKHEVCGVVVWLVHGGCVCIVPELFSESLVCAGLWGEVATRRVSRSGGSHSQKGVLLPHGSCWWVERGAGILRGKSMCALFSLHYFVFLLVCAFDVKRGRIIFVMPKSSLCLLFTESLSF